MSQGFCNLAFQSAPLHSLPLQHSGTQLFLLNGNHLSFNCLPQGRINLSYSLWLSKREGKWAWSLLTNSRSQFCFLATLRIQYFQAQGSTTKSDTKDLSVNIIVFPHLQHHLFPLISTVPVYLPRQLQHLGPDFSFLLAVIVLVEYHPHWWKIVHFDIQVLWLKFPISLTKRLGYQDLIVYLPLPHINKIKYILFIDLIPKNLRTFLTYHKSALSMVGYPSISVTCIFLLSTDFLTLLLHHNNMTTKSSLPLSCFISCLLPIVAVSNLFWHYLSVESGALDSPFFLLFFSENNL